MDERWDVVIVGGGPGGCAAALQVLHDNPAARVLIVDRAEFPRDKVCGDGIAPQVLQALHELGVDPAQLMAGYQARQRLCLSAPGGRVAERALRQDVFVVPRLVLDARLVGLAQSRGAVLRRHTVRRVEENADGVVLDGTIGCAVLIGADGAESVVRRVIGIPVNKVGHIAVAVRGYSAELPGQYGAQLITMTKNRWPAYAWSFPLGDGTANVGYGEVTTAEPVSRSMLLARLDDLLPGLSEAPTGVRGHRLPLSTDRPADRPGRVLLVGDALSLINPLSGEGIYYAVRSGMLAGQAVAAGQDAGARYSRLLRDRLGRHLRHTSALARLMRPPWLINAGVRAAHREQGAFDDLVDLALGEGLITARLVRGLVW